MKKFLMWVGVIFIVLIVIGLFADGVDKNTQTIPPTQQPLSNAAKEAIEAASEAAKEAEQAQAAVDTATNETITASQAEQEAMVAAAEAKEAAAQDSPRFTASQLNAMRSAKSYLDFSGFSRKNLINQLSSDYGEGYSVADATVAVDSLDVDWNEQAVRSAKQYLDYQGFSCKGLIKQLSSQYGEKYTVDQATYGAQQAGACS
ncbi:Ltp family lipoprotein [Acinetobacter pittii]|uniref:Ltp family lipoprotein n=1 Tax=Acinetobacter pittii TaxID=48296 RepID=UPI0021CD7D0A|nr:Ltp family lipoprotein [Acinetobacter pittii]MCU4710397.1 Ltp family lipoprotein [Acinetobacter pittii]